MLKEKKNIIISLFVALIMMATSVVIPSTVFADTGAQPAGVVEMTYFPDVTFNPNGGKVSSSYKKIVKQYERAYSFLPTPTRSKYTFRGWYTKKTGGKKVTPTTIVPTKNDHTLYARWQKTTSYEKEVVKYINKQRKKKKLVSFTWDKKIYKGTTVRAKEITKKFSHVRPNGGSGAKYILKFVKKGRSSGECLGMGFDEPSKLVTAFMKSPSHKAIIMKKKGRTCAVSSRVKSNATYWALGTSSLYR